MRRISAAILALGISVFPATVASANPETLVEKVDRLEVADESASDTYDRDKFHYHSGTREKVLEIEKRNDGTWLSMWDNRVHTDPAGMDADHTVPLKEAWESGAHQWTDAEREEFANDTVNPYVLDMVTSSVNRSKGDKDPFDWTPEFERCEYLLRWATVKLTYGLTADGEEKMAMHNMASECEGSDQAEDEPVADEKPATGPGIDGLAETGGDGRTAALAGIATAFLAAGAGVVAVTRWRRR